MIEVVRLDPYGMDEQDKLDLIKFSKVDYNKRSPTDFIEATLQELFQMWRVSDGDTRFLLITKVIRTARGSKTLYVEGLSGAGFIRRPKEMAEQLFELARKGGCKSVTGWVQRPGMIRWMEAAELPIVASVFMKEIGAEGTNGVPDAEQRLA